MPLAAAVSTSTPAIRKQNRAERRTWNATQNVCERLQVFAAHSPAQQADGLFVLRCAKDIVAAVLALTRDEDDLARVDRQPGLTSSRTAASHGGK